MTDETPPEISQEAAPETPPKKKGNWIFLVLKIAFFASATILIILVVMSKLGGDSPALKQSIEQFITENTGYKAQVGKLNNMTFFPDITFNFESTEVYEPAGLQTIAVIGKVQVAFGFWDVMATTGKIKALNIEGIKTLPGVLLDTALNIDSITIVDAVDKPHLEIKGMAGDQPLKMTAEMTSTGIGRGKKYSFGPQREFNITLGELVVDGVIRTGENAGIVFENLEFKKGGKKIMGGTLNMVRNQKSLDISGDLAIEAHHTDLKPQIGFFFREENNSYFKTEGAIISDNFYTDDFAKGSDYDNAMTILEKAFGKQETSQVTDIKLNAKALHRGNQDKGPFEGPLPLKGWRIDASNLGK